LQQQQQHAQQPPSDIVYSFAFSAKHRRASKDIPSDNKVFISQLTSFNKICQVIELDGN
jgi:hypothetical protein